MNEISREAVTGDLFYWVMKVLLLLFFRFTYCFNFLIAKYSNLAKNKTKLTHY